MEIICSFDLDKLPREFLDRRLGELWGVHKGTAVWGINGDRWCIIPLSWLGTFEIIARGFGDLLPEGEVDDMLVKVRDNPTYQEFMNDAVARVRHWRETLVPYGNKGGLT